MQMNMYLMNYYKCSQVRLDTKYPYIQEKVFISLAIIEKELISRGDADKFTKGTLHGHADEILKKKTPIEFKSVLEPPEGQQGMKCVFVEGAPGIGKSMFALEFCRQQEDVKAFSLVLLLRLREKRVQEIQSVTELFYHEKTDLQQAVTKEVIACEGKNVLFVLDGFDELPTKLRNSSFIVELIQGKHLPKCMVLVTSRPSATADLHFTCKHQIHKHIEILGFTHDHIRKYAESMLSDQPNVLQDFFKYISNNPAIHGMMYIPLNSAIVLEIYKIKRTSGKPVPCTMTQLYSELCLVLLRKYLFDNSDPQADHIQDRLEDIPTGLREKVLNLGKLALEGALKQQITFKHLPDGCVDLGFMNVSTELYLGRKSVVSYSFLHLTLQEFLAAFYVSQLSGVEQKLLFFESMLPFNRFRTNTHLNVLWRFMAGLTGFKDIGWEVVNNIMISQTSSFEEDDLMYNTTQLLLVHCLVEVKNEQIIKTACNAIKKDRDPSILYFGNEPSIDFSVPDAHTPFDCYALGYCVAASGYNWSLNLRFIGGSEVVEMLGCGIHSAAGDVCGHLTSLDLSNNSLTLEAIAYFSKFPPKILNQISILNLCDNQLDKDALDCLADTLSHTFMVNLTDLNVSRNPGSLGGMMKLFQELINTRKLCILAVHDIRLGPSDILALSQLLSLTTSLKQLKIGDENMSPENVSLMLETLITPSSLETLELWWISYTPENANKLKLLENNSNLTNMRLVNNFNGINLALPYIAKALHKNETLKSLILSKSLFHGTYMTVCGSYEYDIGTSSIEALSQMLMVNSTLTSLDIATSKLTRDEVLILSDALQHNSTLRHLGLTKVVRVVDERIKCSMLFWN